MAEHQARPLIEDELGQLLRAAKTSQKVPEPHRSLGGHRQPPGAFSRSSLWRQLLAIARREAGVELAEDVVQEALLIAIEAGRQDLDDPTTRRWLHGVVRNRGRMAARSGRRRRVREEAWQAICGPRDAPGDGPAAAGVSGLLADLPPALRAVAALVLAGHDRREIAYLLALTDNALRQRIRALKRQLAARGLAAPSELAGLNLDLAYGRIRAVLLPALRRHGGVFASHDPDGHLFFVQSSQIGVSRQ